MITQKQPENIYMHLCHCFVHFNHLLGEIQSHFFKYVPRFSLWFDTRLQKFIKYEGKLKRACKLTMSGPQGNKFYFLKS